MKFLNITIEFLYIQNIPGTNFQVKLTILHFWTKLTQTEYFQSKNMKITIEFYVFELV